MSEQVFKFIQDSFESHRMNEKWNRVAIFHAWTVDIQTSQKQITFQHFFNANCKLVSYYLNHKHLDKISTGLQNWLD